MDLRTVTVVMGISRSLEGCSRTERLIREKYKLDIEGSMSGKPSTIKIKGIPVLISKLYNGRSL